jgi:hypothetical protein
LYKATIEVEQSGHDPQFSGEYVGERSRIPGPVFPQATVSSSLPTATKIITLEQHSILITWNRAKGKHEIRANRSIAVNCRHF